MKVKFKEAGKWADPDVNKPQIEVEAGETCDLSLEFAQFVIDAGKGTRVEDTGEEDKTEQQDEKHGKGKKDKGKKPPQKDKSKAES